MSVLSELQPNAVWTYFEEICQVPRPSTKEEKIIDYLLQFAAKHNLEAKSDAVGNVVICKPATQGKENVKTVVLQSHVDMVCEKNNDVEHNFDTDPICPLIDGEWVKAKGTTLGADDGIGIAAAMAVLTATDIEHGPMECLFTIDEETGLTGAAALEHGFITGNVLINLDSEDEGELFIGCAGGKDTVAEFEYKWKKAPKKSMAYKITVKGLTGGHSGDDINKGRGNSNKILTRFLYDATELFDLRIGEFDGGNLRNAIPREAVATVTIPKKFRKEFIHLFEKFAEDVKFELEKTEPELTLELEKAEIPDYVINRLAQWCLLNALLACPHGVITMSERMKGLVETSTNLASVKFTDEAIVVTTSQRSDVDSMKEYIAASVRAVFELAGAEVTHSFGYPGWAPNTDSEILRITKACYEQKFGNTPIVRAIHAGLECGLFLEKYPSLDMVSFGPTLRGVHSPDERIEIPSVQKFWDLLVDVLKNIPEN